MDLINRQDAIEACMKYNGQGHIWSCIMGDIEKLPSAEPEIIRCRDCKHYDGRPCGIVNWYNTKDDFCSRAERRTDE